MSNCQHTSTSTEWRGTKLGMRCQLCHLSWDLDSFIGMRVEQALEATNEGGGGGGSRSQPEQHMPVSESPTLDLELLLEVVRSVVRKFSECCDTSRPMPQQFVGMTELFEALHDLTDRLEVYEAFNETDGFMLAAHQTTPPGETFFERLTDAIRAILWKHCGGDLHYTRNRRVLVEIMQLIADTFGSGYQNGPSDSEPSRQPREPAK